MALVKYGGGVTQASGSIGGTVHARNRFGNYIRARTKPVNPCTVRQDMIRTIMSMLVIRWSTTVTVAQRAAWHTYAAAIAMKNRLGETVYLTGFNHYVRSNVVRYDRLSTVKDDGPAELSLPEKDPDMYCVGYVASQKIAVSFSKLLPWYTDAGSQLVIFMGEPQLATRNFFNGPWKCAGGVSIGEDSPKMITPPFTLTLGQKVWYYGRIMRADGRLSEPFTVASIVLAAAP